MKDYSQNGEQLQVLKYFGDFRGTVLDIGANDGVTFSMSRALIELGWRACLVEPASIPFQKLTALYFPTLTLPSYGNDFGNAWHFNNTENGVRIVRAAITLQDGPLDFYSSGTHLKKGDTDLLSTTHPEEIARWKKSGEVFTKTVVRGITFDTLMRETGVRHFDFISIDAEGADLDILRQIDLTAVGCRMLCVEVNARGDAEFTAYAKRHGMRLHHSNHENRIYVK